jgi:Major tropism determinant N-terminal domain
LSEQLQLRRGTSAQVAAFTGAQGEVVVDTSNNRLVVQDGVTAGGFAAAKLSEAISSAGGQVAALGIGTGIDPGNPLSVTANNVLFNELPSGSGGTGDIRIKLNKASAANTASFLFQDAFAGRAEIGIAGDDNFHFKISADGSAWRDALSIAAATGAVSAGFGFVGSPDPSYLRGYFSGLGLSNDPTSPNSVLDIAPGVANASDSSALMKLPAAMTKTVGPWSAGSGSGGLDAGTIAASSWYHAFLIQRPDTGVVDVLLSRSAISPNMPAAYARKRRLGAVKTDASSHLIAFRQVGNEFTWLTPIADVVVTNQGTSVGNYAVSAPSSSTNDLKVKAMIRGFMSNAVATTLLINGDDESSVASNLPQGNTTAYCAAGATTNFNLGVRTSVAGTIRIIAGAANTSVYIATYGWVDETLFL